MDFKKYERIFTQESEKYLRELEGFLIRVEKTPADGGLWMEIQGKIHSIKGMARALQFEKIVDLAHHLEDWSKSFERDAVRATGESVQVLFDGAGLLKGLVAGKGRFLISEDEDAYRRLMHDLEQGTARFVQEVKSGQGLLRKDDESVAPIDYVRVRYDLIDELMGLSQEIVFLEKTLPPLSDEQVSSGLKGWIDHYTSMMKGLYFRLAQLRLMSMGDFADLFTRPLRNMARDQEKEVTFEVIGGEVQADIAVLDRLREAFLHILRNAISHGIEPSHERGQKGKDPRGKITLEATCEKNTLFIKIRDDGRGIDEGAIREYLKTKRGMKDQEMQNLSRDALREVILEPGFTTVKEATDMAGRGLGMQVVARAVSSLGGAMSISSIASGGTEFIIRLPVSLSMIYAVTFTAGPYVLSIPAYRIDSITRPQVVHDKAQTAWCDLRKILGVQDGEAVPPYILKVRYSPGNAPGGPMGVADIAADRIVGNLPVMVFPQGEFLTKVGIFAGVGVMEDGGLSILLDVEKLRNAELKRARD